MQSADTLQLPTQTRSTPTADPYGVRLAPEVDRIPYGQMHPNLKKVKDLYEASYKAYVQALSSGNQALAKEKLEEFQSTKARYQRALSAYTK